MIRPSKPLPFYHPWFDVTDDEGKLKDRVPRNYQPTIRDADDYSHYVAEGPSRPDMMATTRWEKRWGGPLSRYAGGNGNNMSLGAAYVTQCYVSNSNFSTCFLLDPILDSCSVSNSHIHLTSGNDISSSSFRDCVITTSSDAAVVFVNNNLLTNCTLEGHFAEDVGRSDCQRVANNPPLTPMPPFEVHNNIVFRDRVLRTLRRYVFRFRQRQASLRNKYRQNGLYHHSNHSLRDSVMSDSEEDVLPKPVAWAAKRAEKRPAAVEDRYDAGEQLELPLRRMEWSVERSKKRKIDLTHINLD